MKPAAFVSHRSRFSKILVAVNLFANIPKARVTYSGFHSQSVPTKQEFDRCARTRFYARSDDRRARLPGRSE